MSKGPSVLRFNAALVRERNGAKTAGRTMVDIPAAVSKKFRDMSTVEGTINGHPFRAPLERKASGGHWVRANKAMLAGAGAGVGKTVRLAVLGPQPEPTVPADLRGPLNASRTAKTLWGDLTSDARRIWIRWIESAKTAETRARRITRTVEQLAEGKRRPCCVNVYEFVLDRVGEES